MKRQLLACLIISLWLVCLAPAMPIEAPDQATAASAEAARAPSAASTDLGPSVSLSYAFPALLADTAARYSWGYYGVSVDGGSMTDSHLTSLDSLPFSWYFDYYDAAGTYGWVAIDAILLFRGLTGVGTYGTQHRLTVGYTGITSFTWNITTWFYSVATGAWVSQDCHASTGGSGGGTYSFTDTPNLAYTSAYIDATGLLRVKVRGWAQIVTAGGGAICRDRIEFLQPRTTRTTTTETPRTAYALTGATVLYTFTFMAPESMTNVTVIYPTAWDWTAIQPSASVTETSGQIVITNTDQDTVYSTSFTAPVLATVSWAAVFADSLEASGNNWTVVLDGAASFKLNSVGKTLAYATSVASWIAWSSYGSVVLTYKAGSTATAGAAGKWTTTLSYASAGIDSLAFTTANSLVDGVTVYQSDVEAGSTITGTCRHVHPNGDTGAAFVNVSVGLWDASYAWKAYRDVTTDADGAWSLAATTLYGSLSAQTYKLWTWVYAGANAYWALDAATEATTDWTETFGTSSTVTTSTDCKEGAASIYSQARFDTDDNIAPTYNPSGTWSLSAALMTVWAKVNSTTGLSVVLVGGGDGTGKTAYHRFYWFGTTDMGFAANTWTRMTVPISSSYFTGGSAGGAWTTGFDATTFQYWRLWIQNSTNPNTNGYGIRVDSLNFLTHSTSDTLTYPFALPSDFTITGSFSEGDVKAFYDYTTNYAASYTVYENTSNTASGSIAAGSGSFSWTKGTAIALYNVGVKFTQTGCTGQVWKNWSYTVSAGQTVLWMTFLDAGGHVITWGTFIVYVDSVWQPECWVTVNASSTVNVTLVDDFGQLIYQNAAYPTGAEANTALRQTLVVYTLGLVNRRYYAQYVVVTRSGCDSPKLRIAGYGSTSLLVYGAAAGVEYRVRWYSENSTLTDDDAWTVYLSDTNALSGYEEQPIDIQDLTLNLPNFAFAMFTMTLALVGTMLVVVPLAFIAGRGRRRASGIGGLAPDTTGAPTTATEHKPAPPPTAFQVARQASRDARLAGIQAREAGRRQREAEARRNRGEAP